MDQRLERASLALLERQSLSQSLNSILPMVSEENSLYTERIEKEKHLSLIAYFDHGIDPDPSFSGKCLARIYLDDESQLKLAIWPENKDKGAVREQILLPRVEEFAFRFLMKKPNGSIIWTSERPKEESGPLPSIVRLDLWQKGIEKGEEPLSFVFFLPSKHPPIVYSSHKRKR